MYKLSRRTLIQTTPILLFAPAIVRAAHLMPVKVWKDPSILQDFGGGWFSYWSNHSEPVMIEMIRPNGYTIIKMGLGPKGSLQYVPLPGKDIVGEYSFRVTDMKGKPVRGGLQLGTAVKRII